MKISFILPFCFFLWHGAFAQKNFAASYGLDTSFAFVDSCPSNHIYEYFNVKAKYPESSMSILQRVRNKANESNIAFKQNGFITFRFTINCKGQASFYRLYLMDEDYTEKMFDKEVIDFLYAFVKSLNEWRKVPKTLEKVDANYYNAYINFQIRNGKIISLAP